MLDLAAYLLWQLNNNMMLCFKVHDRPVNAVDFQACLTELKIVCTNAAIETSILVLDNARIHYAQIIDFSGFEAKYLSPTALS